MEVATIGMAPSEQDDVSINIDVVVIVGVDAVASVEAEAEAVIERSDKASPIGNFRVCSRRLVDTGGRFVGIP